MVNTDNKTKPHAPFTTLRACIKESGRLFTKEKLIKLGKDVADAHYLAYGKRPLKVEILEEGKLLLIGIYPHKFKKIIHNIINQTK